MTLLLEETALPTDYTGLRDHHLSFKKEALHKEKHQKNLIERLSFQLNKMRRIYFLLKSDTVAGLLFNEAEVLAEIKTLTEEIENLSPEEASKDDKKQQQKSEKKRHKKAIPEHLTRIEIIHDLKPEEKVCAEDKTPLHKIGEDVSEKLRYVPAKFTVERHITYKYGCRICEEAPVTALRAKDFIPGSMATPSLLAHLTESKYLHHLPLDRQAKIFYREGIDLNSVTLSRWMIRAGEELKPLQDLLREDLVKRDYVQIDETPLKVIGFSEEEAKFRVKLSSKKYMWCAASLGREDKKNIVYYRYGPSRSGIVVSKILEGFKGYMQTDGYSGYSEISKKENVTRLSCLAHVRRKFSDFLSSALKAEERKNHPAAFILKEIKLLYETERICTQKNLSLEARLKVRKEKSKIRFEQLIEYIHKEIEAVSEGTSYAKALAYAGKELPHLRPCFEKEANLKLDNNAIENKIRPFCLGRKNWLFAKTDKGADASAVIYTLIQTALSNGINVREYLSCLFEKWPLAETLEEKRKLLPYAN